MKNSCDGVTAHFALWFTVGLFILGTGITGRTGDWVWLLLGVPYVLTVIWAFLKSMGV